MKIILYILFCFCAGYNVAQSISPSVINSGGKTSTTTINTQTVYYTDNIGEAVIGTGSNSGNKLTQGFLQPDMIIVNNTSVTAFSGSVTCSDRRDGFIFVRIYNPPSGYSAEYFWKPDTLCPNHDCSRKDSLSKGTYTVITVITYSIGPNEKKDYYEHIIDILENNGICNIKVYTGIQASGGNSKFTIDNIDLYPEAEVSIYNRWGVKLFSKTEYGKGDNYWPAKDEKVIPGTYFYIISAGNDKVNKGWVEIFSN
jgi:hypothetical protein